MEPQFNGRCYIWESQGDRCRLATGNHSRCVSQCRQVLTETMECVCLHKGYVDSVPQPRPQGPSSKMRNPAYEVKRSFPFLCCLNVSFETHLPSAYNLAQPFFSTEDNFKELGIFAFLKSIRRWFTAKSIFELVNSSENEVGVLLDHGLLVNFVRIFPSLKPNCRLQILVPSSLLSRY